MTRFFDTAIGKTVKVALWLGGSYLASYLVHFVGHHTFTGIYTILPGIINIAAYGFNTIKDVEVPNLPSSPLMQVVPLVEEAIAEEQDKPATVSSLPASSQPAPSDTVVPPVNPAV
jgi:hypothetical protein